MIPYPTTPRRQALSYTISRPGFWRREWRDFLRVLGMGVEAGIWLFLTIAAFGGVSILLALLLGNGMGGE